MWQLKKDFFAAPLSRIYTIAEMKNEREREIQS